MKKIINTLYAIGRYLLLIILAYHAVLQVLYRLFLTIGVDTPTSIILRFYDSVALPYSLLLYYVMACPEIFSLYASYELFANKRRVYGIALLVTHIIFRISFFWIVSA